MFNRSSSFHIAIHNHEIDPSMYNSLISTSTNTNNNQAPQDHCYESMITSAGAEEDKTLNSERFTILLCRLKIFGVGFFIMSIGTMVTLVTILRLI